MARLGKKTTGEQAVQSVDLAALLKSLGIPFKIKNHELAKFVVSADFAEYPEEFKADFINLTGSGVPFARIYMRINLNEERRDMALNDPKYQNRLLEQIGAGDISYYFQNTASREEAQPMEYAMKNYVFIEIQSWKTSADFVYKKWVQMHGVQPSKGFEVEAVEPKPKKPRKPAENENAE